MWKTYFPKKCRLFKSIRHYKLSKLNYEAFHGDSNNELQSETLNAYSNILILKNNLTKEIGRFQADQINHVQAKVTDSCLYYLTVLSFTLLA
jgi:hypothetical protein